MTNGCSDFLGAALRFFSFKFWLKRYLSFCTNNTNFTIVCPSTKNELFLRLIQRSWPATRASHAKGYKLPKKWVQQIECLIYEIQIPLARLLSELS